MARYLLMLILIPITAILWVLEWCGTYLVHFFGMLCRIVAGTILTLLVIGFVTGLGSGRQLIQMLAVGLLISAIPQVGKLVIRVILLAHAALMRML